MTDIEMLPLPEPDYLMPQGQGWPDIPAWSENTVRQLVAHATAAKDAEIERLQSAYEAMTRQAQHHMEQQDKAEAEIQALRAENKGHGIAIQQLSDRAERLAEALRGIRDYDPVGGDAWLGPLDLLQRKARAALRDHDQEPTNDR